MQVDLTVGLSMQVNLMVVSSVQASFDVGAEATSFDGESSTQSHIGKVHPCPPSISVHSWIVGRSVKISKDVEICKGEAGCMIRLQPDRS